MKKIPQQIIGLLSERLPDFETHASINSLFLCASAPENIPEGSKPNKIRAWLQAINKECEEPLSILGMIIEKYIELPVDSGYLWGKEKEESEKKKVFKNELESSLKNQNLRYIQGGKIIQSDISYASLELNELIKKRDEKSIDIEFRRALDNVNLKPLEAISASCNILEAIFKIYIEEEKLEMPKVQDLKGLWKVVAKNLNFEQSKLQNDDLKRIVSGLFSLIDGISSLRTHGSSAHGQGKKLYMPKPRHARLAINSAHSLSLFILETWNEKNK